MYIYQIMSNNFGYIDIILLGMIAGFIILRLRSILGRKTGHEPKIYPNFADRKFEVPNNEPTEIKLNHDKLEGKDKKEISEQFFNRLNQILETEKVIADKRVLAELIMKHLPDWRRVLNECQRHSVGGKIDSSILATFSPVNVEDLIKNLKDKKFPEVRKWCVNNLDNDPSDLLRRVYDSLFENLEGASIAAAVLIIAKYQYQIAFVADQEINLLACMTEIMVECEFK